MKTKNVFKRIKQVFDHMFFKYSTVLNKFMIFDRILDLHFLLDRSVWDLGKIWGVLVGDLGRRCSWFLIQFWMSFRIF